MRWEGSTQPPTPRTTPFQSPTAPLATRSTKAIATPPTRSVPPRGTLAKPSASKRNSLTNSPTIRPTDRPIKIPTSSQTTNPANSPPQPIRRPTTKLRRLPPTTNFGAQLTARKWVPHPKRAHRGPHGQVLVRGVVGRLGWDCTNPARSSLPPSTSTRIPIQPHSPNPARSRSPSNSPFGQRSAWYCRSQRQSLIAESEALRMSDQEESAEQL